MQKTSQPMQPSTLRLQQNSCAHLWLASGAPWTPLRQYAHDTQVLHLDMYVFVFVWFRAMLCVCVFVLFVFVFVWYSLVETFFRRRWRFQWKHQAKSKHCMCTCNYSYMYAWTMDMCEPLLRLLYWQWTIVFFPNSIAHADWQGAICLAVTFIMLAMSNRILFKFYCPRRLTRSYLFSTSNRGLVQQISCATIAHEIREDGL